MQCFTSPGPRNPPGTRVRPRPGAVREVGNISLTGTEHHDQLVRPQENGVDGSKVACRRNGTSAAVDGRGPRSAWCPHLAAIDRKPVTPKCWCSQCDSRSATGAGTSCSRPNTRPADFGRARPSAASAAGIGGIAINLPSFFRGGIVEAASNTRTAAAARSISRTSPFTRGFVAGRRGTATRL
jgi:hypothetical protein